MAVFENSAFDGHQQVGFVHDVRTMPAADALERQFIRGRRAAAVST